MNPYLPPKVCGVPSLTGLSWIFDVKTPNMDALIPRNQLRLNLQPSQQLPETPIFQPKVHQNHTCGPDSELETPRLHSGTAFGKLQTATATSIPLNPEGVWQQLPKTSTNHHKLNILHNDSAIKTYRTTQELGNEQLTEEASETSPPKEMHRSLTTVPQPLHQKTYGHRRIRRANIGYP